MMPAMSYSKFLRSAKLRRQRIVKMRDAGRSFADIAAQLGISRQRAHELYHRETARLSAK